MQPRRRNPFIAAEGAPLITVLIAAAWLLAFYGHVASLLLTLPLLALAFLVFRDPVRVAPASPLGVICPVDGQVIDVGLTDRKVLQGEAHRLLIRINAFGTYTARSPVEGAIRDLNVLASHTVVEYRTNALWLQTDEKDDVVLQFRGYRLGLAPRAFMGYGERLGQGQRCVYLRLARIAELHLPIESQLLVSKGDHVTAGTDVIAKLPAP